MPSAAPSFSAATISGVSSKRRKCTADVFSSFSRSRSSSAIAYTLAQALGLHPHPILDALQPRERMLALLDILVLDQHRRLEVAAVGDERVVGVELVLDAGFLEDLLDAQHLLDLVAHRELVLEDERHVLAQVHGARLLVRDHLARGTPCAPWRRPRASAGFARDARHRRLLHFGVSPTVGHAQQRERMLLARRAPRRRPSMPCSMRRPAIGQSELT